MASGLDFSGMVPGLDYLQSLMQGASAALPGMAGMASVPGIGQWVTPTLDPQELDKRISELRTVQFWLEQNAKLLGTTIQALEVQRMTLATLQTMNLPLSELRDALSIKPAVTTFAKDPAPRSQPQPEPQPEPEPAPAPARHPAAAGASGGDADEGDDGAAASPAAPAVDPMQWWGALTQQFTEIASQALQAGAAQQAATAQAAGLAPHPAPAPKAPKAPRPAPAAPAAKAAKAAKAAEAASAPAPAAAPAQAAGSAAAKRPGASGHLASKAGKAAAAPGAGPVRRARPRSR